MSIVKNGVVIDEEYLNPPHGSLLRIRYRPTYESSGGPRNVSVSIMPGNNFVDLYFRNPKWEEAERKKEKDGWAEWSASVRRSWEKGMKKEEKCLCPECEEKMPAVSELKEYEVETKTETKLDILRKDWGDEALCDFDFSDLKTLNSVFKNYFFITRKASDRAALNKLLDYLEDCAIYHEFIKNEGDRLTLEAIILGLRSIFGELTVKEQFELSKYAWTKDRPFRYQIVASPDGEDMKYYIVFSTAPKYLGDD